MIVHPSKHWCNLTFVFWLYFHHSSSCKIPNKHQITWEARTWEYTNCITLFSGWVIILSKLPMINNRTLSWSELSCATGSVISLTSIAVFAIHLSPRSLKDQKGQFIYIYWVFNWIWKLIQMRTQSAGSTPFPFKSLWFSSLVLSFEMTGSNTVVRSGNSVLKQKSTEKYLWVSTSNFSSKKKNQTW